MRTSHFLAIICIAIGPALAAAQTTPTPLARADIDKKAYNVAYDTVAMGAELFNSGNQEGCLRLYEGSLMTLVQFLDHKPDLVKTINDKMAKAKATHRVADKAFALREALDAVMGVDKATMAAPAAKKPLWDRLGGQKAVEAVVHDFVVMAAGDAKVNFLRDGKFKLDDAGVANLEKLLVELISATTGGPLKYTGKDMKKSHAGMKITDAEFDALAGDLIAVLNKYKVPKAELDELIAIVGSTRGDIVEVKK